VHTGNKNSVYKGNTDTLFVLLFAPPVGGAKNFAPEGSGANLHIQKSCFPNWESKLLLNLQEQSFLLNNFMDQSFAFLLYHIFRFFAFTKLFFKANIYVYLTHNIKYISI